MTEDRMDDLIRDLARDYNRPDAPPREEMWARVSAGRHRPAAVPRRWSRWMASVAAAAAVLVVGIAIGRMMERSQGRGSSPERVAQAPRRDTAVSAPVEATQPQETAVRPTSKRRELVASRSSAPLPDTRALAARLVLSEQLAGTEAMLTAFRAQARTGAVDAQITSWARDVLATTRTLRGSAAGSDPTMQRLLDDLELVLVQIAQYTSTNPHHAEDLELIQQAIERHGVIGRLRTLPAGAIPAGT